MNFRTKQSIFNIIALAIIACFVLSCNTREEQPKSVSVDQLREQLLTKHPNWKEDDICLEEIKEFKNLILVGSFANDRGCTNFTPYYFGKQQLSESFITDMMTANGYSKSPEKLIKAFHLKIINIEKSILQKLPEKTDSILDVHYHNYTLTEENNTYVSSVWVKHPSGMTAEDKYSESIATFDKSTGVCINSVRVNPTNVPMN